MEQDVLNASQKLSRNYGSAGKILENTKYMEDDFYPPLIDKVAFEQVWRSRQERVESHGRNARLNSFANRPCMGADSTAETAGNPIVAMWNTVDSTVKR